MDTPNPPPNTKIVSLNFLFSWIEAQSTRKYYTVYLTLALVLLSLLFATPRYLFHLDRYQNNPAHNVFESIGWKTVMLKSQKPLDPLTHLDSSFHEAKKVFRLSVPIIMRVLGLNPLTTYLLQFVIGILLIALSYRLAEKILADAVSSTFLTTGLVFIYFGRACFIDLTPWLDGWAFFFMIIAMAYSYPVSIFLFCSLAAWTDERAFISLPIILFYHCSDSLRGGMMQSIKQMLTGKPAISLLAAIAFYIVLRLFLTIRFDMTTPIDDILPMVYRNVKQLQLSLWSFFEGFWLLVISSIAIMVFARNYFLTFLILSQIAIITAVSLTVLDTTRSGSYLVPLLFVLVAHTKYFISQKDLRYLLLACAFFCVIFPAYYIIGALDYQKPIFIEVLYFLLSKAL